MLKTPARSRMIIILALYSIFILTASLVSRYITPEEGLTISVYLPTALITILISILVNTRTGIISAVILSVSLFLIPGDQVNNFIFSLVSGILGSLVVYKAEHRIVLVKAGLIISLINVGVAVTLGLMQNSELNYYLDAVIFSFINVFSAEFLPLDFFLSLNIS